MPYTKPWYVNTYIIVNNKNFIRAEFAMTRILNVS